MKGEWGLPATDTLACKLQRRLGCSFGERCVVARRVYCFRFIKSFLV